MRVAVIGAGIAGGAAAWALARSGRHEVAVYEREGRPGGHSLTVDVDQGGVPTPVDLGFIVHNDETYPDFTRLLAELGVGTRRADMSFCLAGEDGEAVWSSRRLPLPADASARERLALGADWLRFNRAARADLAAGRLDEAPLAAYLDRIGIGARFRADYLAPMAAAIWSMPPGDALALPARTFVAFFESHRLLRLARPTWRTVVGGSRAYVERLAAPWRRSLRPAAARVTRGDSGVEVVDARGARDRFDALVMACHADEALALLADPSAPERAVLGAIRFRPGEVVLHRDAGLMPGARAAWAAWTIRRDPGPAVTYWMNRLLGLDPAHPLFVSLDPPVAPADSLVLARARMSHPQLDAAAIRAQAALAGLQGARRTWFCGAWTGYGFHEDGARSGLDAAAALGAPVPWRAHALPEAAE